MDYKKWKQILETEIYCQECLKLKLVEKMMEIFRSYGINFENINYNIFAGEVYNNISVCNNCFRLLTATKETKEEVKRELEKQRRYKIFYNIYLQILKQQKWIEIARKQHTDFINSITMKPMDWLNKKIMEDKESDGKSNFT